MNKQEQGDFMRRIDHGMRSVVDREEEIIERKLEDHGLWRNVVFTVYGSSHPGNLTFASQEQARESAKLKPGHLGYITADGCHIWADWVAFVLQMPVPA